MQLNELLALGPGGLRKLYHFRLAEIREAAGYTQAEFSRLIGRSRQAVGIWESEKSTPHLTSALYLSKVLGCKIDDLLELIAEDGSDSRQTCSEIGQGLHESDDQGEASG
jgi:DNA-binding XRE family transcriptional regulator